MLCDAPNYNVALIVTDVCTFLLTIQLDNSINQELSIERPLAGELPRISAHWQVCECRFWTSLLDVLQAVLLSPERPKDDVLRKR